MKRKRLDNAATDPDKMFSFFGNKTFEDAIAIAKEQISRSLGLNLSPQLDSDSKSAIPNLSVPPLTPKSRGAGEGTDGGNAAAGTKPTGARGKSKSDGSAAAEEAKASLNKKRNPRQDLLVLPDIPLENDTRRMRDGYNYVSGQARQTTSTQTFTVLLARMMTVTAVAAKLILLK